MAIIITNECINCGWLINKPMSKTEVKKLISVINEVLSRTKSNYHAKQVIKKLIKRLNWQMNFLNCNMSKYPICRHCLISLATLYTKHEEKINEIAKQYDFGNAIIY